MRSLVEESCIHAIWMNLDTIIFHLGERGFLVTMIKKCDCNLHVRWSNIWLEILISGKNEISFYWDGLLFVHKYNPKSGTASNRARVWQKREEGLQLTTKACKDLAGGRHCACYRRHSIQKRSRLESTVWENDRWIFCDIYLGTFQKVVQKQMVDAAKLALR